MAHVVAGDGADLGGFRRGDGGGVAGAGDELRLTPKQSHGFQKHQRSVLVDGEMDVHRSDNDAADLKAKSGQPVKGFAAVSRRGLQPIHNGLEAREEFSVPGFANSAAHKLTQLAGNDCRYRQFKQESPVAG
jgi:hypothetical protein